MDIQQTALEKEAYQYSMHKWSGEAMAQESYQDGYHAALSALFMFLDSKFGPELEAYDPTRRDEIK